MAVHQTWVQIKERSFLDLLDLALMVVRERPLTLGLTALLGVAPFAALNTWLASLPEFPAFLLPFMFAVEAPWATAPLTVVLGGMMFGERPGVPQVSKALARAFVPMFFLQFMARILLMSFFLFYIIVPIRFGFVNEVALLERGRWRAVYRRSANLSEDCGGDLFGQWLGQFFFGGLFVLGFWAGTGAILQVLFSNETTWDPQTKDMLDIRMHFAVWLAISFFAVVRFLTYLDRRIRLEGWELELRLRSAGRALEADRRW